MGTSKNPFFAATGCEVAFASLPFVNIAQRAMLFSRRLAPASSRSVSLKK